MVKLVLPMSGPSLYSTAGGYSYPKLLTEVHGKTLLEYALQPFSESIQINEVVALVPKKERKQNSLRDVIGFAAKKPLSLIDLNAPTGGGLCTALMAVDELGGGEIVIASADQYLPIDLDEILNRFRNLESDAGVLTFKSVHPKWSYAKLDERALVLQTAEKKPISDTAMAGFFYFNSAKSFVEAAKNVIRKQNSINGSYYVSSTINELILAGKKVSSLEISGENYHNFYDEHSIRAFEASYDNTAQKNYDASRAYVDAFNSKDLDSVVAMFASNSSLIDPNVKLNGKENIAKFIGDLFSNSDELSFREKKIISSGNATVIEFALIIDGKSYIGTDVITWQDGKIKNLAAYLYSDVQ